MPSNPIRRAFSIGVGVLCLASGAAAESHGTRPSERLLGEIGAPPAVEALAAPTPLRSALRALKLPPGLQIDRKAGLRYHARLPVGNEHWVLRVKGPLLKRKRLGLGLEVKF